MNSSSSSTSMAARTPHFSHMETTMRMRVISHWVEAALTLTVRSKPSAQPASASSALAAAGS